MLGNRLPAMGTWVRRVLALGVLLAVLAVFPSAAALAETTPPTPPTASAPATPSPSPTSTDQAEDEDADLPDVPLDDTRTMLALVGAGVLAVVAGVVVLVRR